MSSDSSDDEDLSKFREAADFQFINDAMFDQKQAKERHTIEPQSLRRSRDEDEQFNLFRVTPEFRNYVAKHLSNVLDQVLQKKLTTNYDTHLKPKRRKSGIRLFRNSQHYIKLKSHSSTVTKTKTNQNSDEEEDETKFKSVAVTPEDILTKKDTQHWSTRSKAPVYAYHKTKHGLILK